MLVLCSLRGMIGRLKYKANIFLDLKLLKSGHWFDVGMSA